MVGNINPPRIRLHQYVAVALVVVAHGWITSYFVGNHLDRIAPAPSGGERVVTIQLGAAEPGSDEQRLTQVNPDLQEEQDRDTKPSTPQQIQVPASDPTPAVSQDTLRYYRTSELTDPPVVLQDVLTIQPLQSIGKEPKIVILRLLINEYGGIDQVLVESSELPVDSTKLLVDRFSNMKFAPGKLGGAAVRSQLTIQIDATSFQ